MTRKTAQDKINSRIKFKIYNTMLLYSKKGQISTISTRLQKVESAYNKGQDTIITD